MCGKYDTLRLETLSIAKPGASLSKRFYDAIVVGAGVFGVWTAYYLKESGNSVLLLDAFGAGNIRSSSGDESRVMRMGYGSDELYTRSAMRSLPMWLELFASRRCGHLFRRTGSLWMGRKNDAYMKETAKVLKRVGVEMEEISGSELKRRYPQFNSDGIECGRLEPEGGAILARQAVCAVLDAYVERGGEFLVGRAMPPRKVRNLTSLTMENGDKYSAAVLVFACGPWLGKLFPELLGGRIFITRQEIFYFNAPREAQYEAERMPAWYHADEQFYGLPNLDGHGLKALSDRHGPPFDPDKDDRMVSAEGLAQIRGYLARRMPALASAPLVETRICQYENTSSGDFLLDRHPEAENVWLAGGGSGHGFKHGPEVGRYLSAQIDGTGATEPRYLLGSKSTVQSRIVF